MVCFCFSFIDCLWATPWAESHCLISISKWDVPKPWLFLCKFLEFENLRNNLIAMRFQSSKEDFSYASYVSIIEMQWEMQELAGSLKDSSQKSDWLGFSLSQSSLYPCKIETLLLCMCESSFTFPLTIMLPCKYTSIN